MKLTTITLQHCSSKKIGTNSSNCNRAQIGNHGSSKQTIPLSVRNMERQQAWPPPSMVPRRVNSLNDTERQPVPPQRIMAQNKGSNPKDTERQPVLPQHIMARSKAKNLSAAEQQLVHLRHIMARSKVKNLSVAEQPSVHLRHIMAQSKVKNLSAAEQRPVTKQIAPSMEKVGEADLADVMASSQNGAGVVEAQVSKKRAAVETASKLIRGFVTVSLFHGHRSAQVGRLSLGLFHPQWSNPFD
jgi:hypothetical protein